MRSKLLVSFLALSVSAFAADGGVTSINQGTVQSSGGYPYVISQPGSYKLAGNLNTTHTTAIQITANDVVLDLSGFTISCSACTGVPGIYSSAMRTSISNGTVAGFSGSLAQRPYGIYFAAGGGSADRVKVTASGWGIFAAGSITVTNSVLSNNVAGIECDGVLVLTGSQIANNSSIGAVVNAGTLTGNTIDSNGTQFPQAIGVYPAGVQAIAATIIGNIFSNNANNGNAGYAIYVNLNLSGAAVIYSQNSFIANRAIASGAAQSVGNNVCGGPGSGGSLC